MCNDPCLRQLADLSPLAAANGLVHRGRCGGEQCTIDSTAVMADKYIHHGEG